MRMNRTGLVFLIVILIFSISLFTGCSKSSQEKCDVINIGVAQALSGPIAPYGESIRRGILLAIKQINERDYIGNGKKLEIFIEDTGGDKQKAISVFKKLITRDKVVAIIGPTLDNSAFAADPVAQKAGIPVIGSSTVAKEITDIGEYIFSTYFTESGIIANTISTLVGKRGMFRIAVMYGDNDQFTKNAYDYFTAALSSHNVTVLITETFAKGDTDFSTQLNKIKPLKPQAIIISGQAEESARIMIQARELGIADAYFVGGNGFYTSRLTRRAGKAAEGAIFGVVWHYLKATPENKQFIIDFGLAYTVDPDQFAAQSYTAVWILAEAIRRAGSSGSKAIRDQLALIRDFPSPLGKFSFDANRRPQHEPVVLIVRNTVFSLYE